MCTYFSPSISIPYSRFFQYLPQEAVFLQASSATQWQWGVIIRDGVRFRAAVLMSELYFLLSRKVEIVRVDSLFSRIE